MTRPSLHLLRTQPAARDGRPEVPPPAPAALPIGRIERALARLIRASEAIGPLLEQVAADPAQLVLLPVGGGERIADVLGTDATAHRREVQALSAEMATLALELERKRDALAEREQLLLELRDAKLRAETRAEHFERESKDLDGRVARLRAELWRRRSA
jgi:hypothetical protein